MLRHVTQITVLAALTVLSNFAYGLVFVPGQQYSVQIDGTGHSTNTINPGTISLLGGDVDVTAPSGTYLVNFTYQIAHSNTTNGLTGSFSQVIPHGFFNPELVTGQLSYDAQSAYVTMRATLDHCATTQNQFHIADQLDAVTNPPQDLQMALQALVALPCNEVGYAVDKLGGEQYAGELIVADMANRQFIRRLYDPLRSIVKSPPCYSSLYDPCCITQPAETGNSVWVEGGGSRVMVDSGHEGYGLNATGYEIVGGLQRTFDYEWTLGLAVGYFQNNIQFKLPGRGKMNTIDVGIYGLYRPNTYYIVTDLTFATTTDKMVRTIEFGGIHSSAHGKSHIYQGTFYGEVGVDYTMAWPFMGCVLAQPFLGIELGYVHRSQVKERLAGALDLTIGSKNFFKSYSRLGVHFSTMPEFGQMQLMLDLAWLYRLADAGRTNHTHFTAFGDSFGIQGAPEGKSSLEGILNLTVPVGSYVSFYVEVIGQLWSASSSYSVIGGIQSSW